MLAPLAAGALLLTTQPMVVQEPPAPPTEVINHWPDAELEDSGEAPLLGLKYKFDDWLFAAGRGAELVIDQSTRFVQTSNGGGPGILNWIGLDFLTHIEGADGQSIGTLLVQPFALHADGLPKTPPIFDDPHDWALQFRYVQLDVTRWAHRGVSWRLGHFEVPFGLEYGIDTNGTLHQFSNGSNLGVKGDWGTSLYGESNGVNYEVAITRGSGNEYRESDGNRVIAARVGNSLEENLCFGVSYMDAQLTGLDPPAMMNSFPMPARTRFGADFRWHRRTHSLLGETSFGTNDGEDVWASLLELNASSNDERLVNYAQVAASGSKTSAGWVEQEVLRLGFRQHMSANSTLSIQWDQDLNLPSRNEKSVIAVQLRFRF